MISFRNIRLSIASFIITPNKPTVDEKHPKEPDKRLDLSSTKQQNTLAMNSNSILDAWLTGSTRGEGSTATKSRKRQRSPLASEESKKKRVVDPSYALPTNDGEEEDFEGPTLVDDDEVMGGTIERAGSSPLRLKSQSPGAPSNAATDLDGDTLITGAKQSSNSENSENGSTDSLSDGAQDNHFPKHAHGKYMELPKLDRKLTGLESDYESDASAASETSSSESELSDDDMTVTSPKNGRSRRGSGSVRADRDLYRPSPDIVDKDLTSDIVSRDAEESDLSEEEILREKVRVRKDDRKEVAFDNSMESARRWAGAVKLPKGHWANAEQDLYFRLAMRGFEPIVPGNWKMDFPTLPTSLFAEIGGPEPYIHSINVKEFRAIKFLSDLFFVGNRVRDRVLAGLRAEPTIGRYVNNYIKWALTDADVDNRPNSIPTYTIYALRGSQKPRDGISILNRRLVTLANRYRQAWRLEPSVENNSEFPVDDEKELATRYLDRQFPVITGFLICGPMIALMTLNSDPAVEPVFASNASGKFISQFDFSEGGQDVWNALAIAMTVMRLRKTIMELVEDGAGDPMWMVGEKVEEVDPDL